MMNLIASLHGCAGPVLSGALRLSSLHSMRARRDTFFNFLSHELLAFLATATSFAPGFGFSRIADSLSEKECISILYGPTTLCLPISRTSYLPSLGDILVITTKTTVICYGVSTTARFDTIPSGENNFIPSQKQKLKTQLSSLALPKLQITRRCTKKFITLSPTNSKLPSPFLSNS